MRKCRRFGVFTALLLILPAVAAAEISDAEITLAVEAELMSSEISAHLVDVETQNGVVTLTGRVDHLLARDRTAVLAGQVKGVRAVVNRIDVDPPERSDEAIKKDIRSALEEDPATEKQEIDVEVQNGIARLSGRTDSWQERQLCLVVAKGIQGVRDVESDIRVQPGQDRPDAEIRAEVKRYLELDFWVDEEAVEVQVDDGRVSLDGFVGSADEKSRARSDAWVTGVRSVDASGLAVDWKRNDPMQSPGSRPPASEEAIRSAVEDAFVYDPRVKPSAVKVSVEDRTVVLTGAVDNLQAKAAAAENAQNTAGVRRVKNHIKVRTDEPVEDAPLFRRVERTLARDAAVDREQIKISTINQKVYLYGTVDSVSERRRAEQLVSKVSGVVAVANHLEVRPPERRVAERADREIRQAVVDQLRWSPHVDADDVQVIVDNGRVRLVGEVPSWRAYKAAEKNAYEGDALSVRNDLTVDSAQ